MATAPGPGAVCILRLSGPEALAVLRRCAPRVPTSPTPRTLQLQRVVDPKTGETIDQALVVFFAGPASFTGEDVVEIQAHGGEAIAQALLSAAQVAGARLARPGEFSRRAFENGRLDLAQAEGLAALIEASSAAGLRAARALFGGELSARVEGLLSTLRTLLAPLEASLDFPDDLEERDDLDAALSGQLTKVESKLRVLQRGYARGLRQRAGARVVLAGAPNVGKSSLFNALCGHGRAIVHETPGTTRDLVEATMEVGGEQSAVTITLVDTAGLRAPDAKSRELSASAIEVEGHARTRAALRGADLILWVEDLSRSVDAKVSDAVFESEGGDAGSMLRVGNKADLLPTPVGAHGWVGDYRVSARTGEGLEALVEGLAKALGITGGSRPHEVGLSLARHAEAVSAAAEAVGEARKILHAGGGLDALVEELREARRQLAGILGRIALPEEILDAIFDGFCLGK